MDRILDADPETGVIELFHYDPDTERVVIETRHDVTDIIEHNKCIANEFTSLDRWGDMTRVASIPMSLYMEMKKQGIIDDQAAMKRWLNDPDNRFFRTRPGVV